MAGGGGGHEDGLQDYVENFGACVGRKGADMTEGPINAVEAQVREADD